MTADDPGLIVRVAARGEGVTADGRFVPHTAPGDCVDHQNRIIRGQAYVSPPCQHFAQCGGCQLQHLSDAAYAEYILCRVADALHAQGLAAPTMDPPQISPPRTRRRASMRAERRGKRVVLGFNEGSSNRIVDIRDCYILQPELFMLVKPLRHLLGTMLRDGARGSVSLAATDQGVDVTLAGFEADGLDAVEALSAFGAAHGLARLSLDEGYGPSVRYAPGVVTVTLGGVPVGFPVGAFLQATQNGEAALVDAVRAATAGAAAVVDLFAGLGTFALSMPARIHAVEGARDAALSLAAIKRVSVEHRDLFRRPLSAKELDRFDAIILDPPRAGATAQIAEIAASNVSRVAYVSCNPATFARDARMLIDGGYKLQKITPVGQFRWSTHVELAAAFAR